MIEKEKEERHGLQRRRVSSIASFEEAFEESIEVIEDTVINVVDRFEDEIADHVYEELVPLQLKLALEGALFGWTHLSSSILGHAVITLGAYFITSLLWDFLFGKTQSTSVYFIKVFLCNSSAVSAFKVVRRRRSVWLRSVYGKQLDRDEERKRQADIAHSDGSTLLGRIRLKRDVYRKNKSRRHLLKAQARFDTWTQKRLSPARMKRGLHSVSFQTLPVSKTKSIENDQVIFRSGSIKNVPYAHGGFFGAAPFMLANPDWVEILRLLMPDVYIEMSRRIDSPAPKLIHWAENNPVVAAYGTANALVNKGKLINLEWDIFLDPSLVRRVELVLEEQEKLKTSCLIVDDSFGEKQHKAIQGFLKKELSMRTAELVDKMVVAHGNLRHLLLEQCTFAKRFNFSRVKRTRRTLGGGMYARQWMAVYAEALRLGTKMAEIAEDIKVQYYQEEDEVSSAIERSRSYESNAESVDSYCPSLSEAPEHFLHTQKSLGEENNLSNNDGRKSPLDLTALSLSSSYCPNTSIRDSVSVLRSITKKEKPIGLILDLKSRHIHKRVWSLVINKLLDAGAHIEGIASFSIDEIRDITRFCRNPDTVKEIIFFHSAGDLQDACHTPGRIRKGDIVFFNGGSLLWEGSQMFTTPYLADLCSEICTYNFDPMKFMKEYSLLPFAKRKDIKGGSTIKDYKEKLELKIGIYVQEFRVDEYALDLLVKTVNENADIYELGFGWGGLNGVTVHGIQPGRCTATDGFDTQRYAGKSWDPNKSASDLPS
mmetsp:Transcript_26343/g.39907  ORF Transcript_26343/g.39907 Transcript_26343/m.39907 type:complete len:767 (+) Transcript_26343:255-2555(+)